jgi:hypothetical protein
MWFSRIDAILATLGQVQAQYLDRRAIEELFGVRPRRAQQIMTGLAPAFAIGRNVVVERAQLLRSLEALSRGEDVARFRTRQRRAADEIEQARSEAAARQVNVPAIGGRMRRGLENLPSTVRLTPGRLEVRFTDINDLWRQLGELAGAAVADRDRFREAAAPDQNA